MKMKHCKRIAFIVNFVTPYRVTFYTKLNLHQEYDWLFLHGIKKKEDGRPAYQGSLNFPNQPVGYKESKLGPFHVCWQSGVLKQIQEYKPQVVITLGILGTLTNLSTLIWSKLNNAKNIIWHAGWEAQSENQWSLVIKQWVARQYLRLADHILVYSSKGAGYLETLGVPPEKISICYNGLEIDPLIRGESEFRKKAQELRKREKLDGKKVFLYVGGMIAEKQVPLLLDAFQSFDSNEKVVLWLVGDGSDLTAIRNLVLNKQHRTVKFWGRIIEEVDVFFAAADYFILPGIGGLALNQALFWGLPCVVSDADGTEDDLVLDGKTGFRFVAKNVNSLKSALIKCIELTETQRIAYGNAGRALVLERSNVNQMVHTFIKVINKITES